MVYLYIYIYQSKKLKSSITGITYSSTYSSTSITPTSTTATF